MIENSLQQLAMPKQNLRENLLEGWTSVKNATARTDQSLVQVTAGCSNVALVKYVLGTRQLLSLQEVARTSQGRWWEGQGSLYSCRAS